MSTKSMEEQSETLCRYLAAVLERSELEIDALRNGTVLLEALHAM